MSEYTFADAVKDAETILAANKCRKRAALRVFNKKALDARASKKKAIFVTKDDYLDLEELLDCLFCDYRLQIDGVKNILIQGVPFVLDEGFGDDRRERIIGLLEEVGKDK